jgi:purine-nucleoside phosphorylase
VTHSLHHFAELQTRVRAQPPRLALVLGSGLGNVTDRLCDAAELPFAAVPGLPAPSVTGHRGTLLHGMWGTVPVLVFAGRLHYYEGHSWQTVLRPIQVAHELGAPMLIVTNAAGGIRADLQPGDLLAIRGHLDCTTPASCLALAGRRADAKPSSGEGEYSQLLIQRLQAASVELGFNLTTGIYAQVTGPCYETAAEIRALRACGADAVGMSTAREVEEASRLGMTCAALSCITNKAAGLAPGPLCHDEVMVEANRARERLMGLLDVFLHGLFV